MSQTIPGSEWLQQLVDPYAVLVIPVSASEGQILKRYHSLAKQLHPDRSHRNYSSEPKLAQTIFSRLINPAYGQIKSCKNPQNTIENVKTEFNSSNLWENCNIQTPVAREMMELLNLEADLFYEEAITSLANVQYKLLDRAEQITQQLRDLNIVYLGLQQKVAIAEQSTALMTQDGIEAQPQHIEKPITSKQLLESYAQRHYQRAMDYLKQSNWKLAVTELREAIHLNPKQSYYHALLGLVHLKQNLPGMARVYMRQALKLNPEHRLALKYAPILNIAADNNPSPMSIGKAVSIAVIFSKFLVKKTFQSYR